MSGIDEASLQEVMRLLGEIQAAQKMVRRLIDGEPLAIMVGEGVSAGAVVLSEKVTEQLRLKVHTILSLRIARLIREKDELARAWAPEKTE